MFAGICVVFLSDGMKSCISERIWIRRRNSCRVWKRQLRQYMLDIQTLKNKEIVKHGLSFSLRMGKLYSDVL